jgi:hypothetical protein
MKAEKTKDRPNREVLLISFEWLSFKEKGLGSGKRQRDTHPDPKPAGRGVSGK